VVKVQGLTQKLVQATDPDIMESLIQRNQALVKDGQARVEQVAAGDDDVKTAFLALIQANQQATNLVLLARNAESHQAIIAKSNPHSRTCSAPSTAITTARPRASRMMRHGLESTPSGLSSPSLPS
jgi:hypothetical protein